MRLTIPNQLTILRIILTPVFIYYFLQNSADEKLAGTIIFIIASATDWYDGYIARRFNIVTRWGQFMDPLADKILISAAFITFAFLDLVLWWMVWIIVVRDFLITFLRIYATHHGKSVVTSVLAKWKTFTQMVIVFVILAYQNLAGFGWLPALQTPPGYFSWVTVSMLIVTFLTALSGITYLVENRSHVKEIFHRIQNLFT